MKELKSHPFSEGWINVTMKINHSSPLTDDEIKEICTLGKQANYEFGPVSQKGNKLTAVTRSLTRKPKEPCPTS